jgi:hypothetical protein
MSLLHGRVPSVLHARQRSARRATPTPLAPGDKQERRRQAQEKNLRLNTIIKGWITETDELAARMADEFGLSHRQCLDLLYQSGVKSQHERVNPSAWNAFLCIKAAEAAECVCFFFFLFFYSVLCH